MTATRCLCRRNNVRRPCRLMGIYQVAQLLAGLEVRNTFRWDLHFGPGLGVASDTGFALPDPEASEPTNFNLVARLECSDYGIEDCIHNHFAVAPCQVAKLRDFFNQFCLCHGQLSSSL